MNHTSLKTTIKSLRQNNALTDENIAQLVRNYVGAELIELQKQMVLNTMAGEESHEDPLDMIKERMEDIILADDGFIHAECELPKSNKEKVFAMADSNGTFSAEAYYEPDDFTWHRPNGTLINDKIVLWKHLK